MSIVPHSLDCKLQTGNRYFSLKSTIVLGTDYSEIEIDCSYHLSMFACIYKLSMDLRSLTTAEKAF